MPVLATLLAAFLYLYACSEGVLLEWICRRNIEYFSRETVATNALTLLPYWLGHSSGRVLHQKKITRLQMQTAGTVQAGAELGRGCVTNNVLQRDATIYVCNKKICSLAASSHAVAFLRASAFFPHCLRPLRS